MKYIEFDIWGNVSKFINDDLIINQTFLGSELLLYEDNVGTYWINAWGDYPGTPYVINSKSFDNTFDIFGLVGNYEWYMINVNGTVIEITPNELVYVPITYMNHMAYMNGSMYNEEVFTQQVLEISNNWLVSSQFGIRINNEG